MFIIVSPSAPPASTAFAIATISVTLGDSFTYTGTDETAFTFSVRFLATSGSVPNCIPPCLTLGQDILSSKALTLGALEILSATYT